MNPVETLNALREQGFKVSVRHKRLTFIEAGEVAAINPRYHNHRMEAITDMARSKHERPNETVSPRGGQTIVTAVSPDMEYGGIAICSIEDNFVKRVGLAKATGRLVGELKRSGITIKLKDAL